MPPTNIRAHRQDQVLELTWPDGVTQRLPFKRVRFECPCAGCVNEMTGERMLRMDSVPDDVAPTSLSLTGNYALKIHWSDGHNTGLYAWDVLRRIGDEFAAP
ncbi:MAG: DUF971 domain-containing protein [Planctomyces sp.]|nr:DUF971 domain-containing protein [Planctomyces sp.]